MKKIKEFILYWSASFFVGTLSLIGKVYPIKIGHLLHNRAHLLVNTEFWLKKNCVPSRGLNIFLSARDPWNRQILKMIKRKVLVCENHFIYCLLQAFQKRRPESNIWIDISNAGHFRPDIWNSVPPQLVFTKEEEDKGKMLLKKMGIGENEPYVCFYSRDDKFLNEKIKNGKWDYHRFRNSNIEDYLKAIEWLTTEKGYWALRMGALVEKPLKIQNPRIIDYATTCRSDFMDVYLLSHCRFTIGDSAGPIAIPFTFNIPYIEGNLIPIGGLARSKNAISLPKKLMDKRTGKLLTISEIFQKGLDFSMFSEDYEKAGVEVINNTPDEIADAVKEMHLRLEGQWQQTSEDDRLQEKFRASIPEGDRIKNYVSVVGASFLRNNQELLK